MWSGPCQQLALATVLDAPHGPRPTHEHVRKTSPVTCCASAVTDTSSTCALWGSAIAHRVRCAGQNSRTAGRGGPPSHVGLGRSLGRGMGIYRGMQSPVPVKLPSSYACGRGGAPTSRGGPYRRYHDFISFSHTGSTRSFTHRSQNQLVRTCERGPRARCERKKRTRWPTPDS